MVHSIPKYPTGCAKWAPEWLWNSKGCEIFLFFLAWLENLKLFPFHWQSDDLEEARKSHSENWYFHIDKWKYQRQAKKRFRSTSNRYHRVNHHVVLWLSSSVKCLKCCLVLFAICLVLRGWLCVCSWDATPKPCHILGLEEKGGCQELKRDDEWVCASEWGKRKPSKGSLLLCMCVCVSVLSCVRTCDQECIYVWEEGILPAVFFPEPLPVSPPHTILKAGVGGFGLGKIQPTRGDWGEEPVFLSLLRALSVSTTLWMLL